MKYEPKPVFIERITKLLKDKQDVEKFFELAKTRARKSIRCNTLKIQPDELVKRIKKFRKGVMEINVSKICAKAIKKELDKLEGEK